MSQERRLSSASARNLAAIALALVIFVSLNVWAGLQLGALRLDLTEERIFTLSEGTRQVLSEIDEPITLRLYQSRKLSELGPFLGAYVKRVDELLGDPAHAEMLARVAARTAAPAAAAAEIAARLRN